MAKNDSKKKIEAKAKGFLGNWIVRNLLLAALLIVGLLLRWRRRTSWPARDMWA